MAVTVYKYQDTIADPATGRPVAGATVTVKKHGGANATLYDEAGLVVQPNPVLTDRSGLFYFWAAVGTYDLVCSVGGSSAARTGVFIDGFVDMSGGVVGFSTLAMANSGLASIPDKTPVWINGDPTPLNNGYWLKTGGVLVQSSNDRVSFAEAKITAMNRYPFQPAANAPTIDQLRAFIVDADLSTTPGYNPALYYSFSNFIKNAETLDLRLFSATDAQYANVTYTGVIFETPVGWDSQSKSVQILTGPHGERIAIVPANYPDAPGLVDIDNFQRVGLDPRVFQKGNATLLLAISAATKIQVAADIAEVKNGMATNAELAKLERLIPVYADGVTTRIPLTNECFNGAMPIDRGFIIPIGQTGQTTYLSAYMPILDVDLKKFIGQKILFTWIADIVNFDGRTFSHSLTSTGNAIAANYTNGAYDPILKTYTVESEFVLTLNSILDIGLYAMCGAAAPVVLPMTMTIKEVYWKPVDYVPGTGFSLIESYEVFATRKQIEYERRKRQVLTGKDRTILTANADPGATANFVGRRAVQDAIDSILDNSPDNKYEIRCTGTFLASDYTHFDKFLDGQAAFISTKDYVDLVGKGEFNIVGTLPDGYVPALLCQPLFVNTISVVENCFVVGKNMNYAVHFEGYGSTPNITRIFKNVYMKYLGTRTALGYGMSGGEVFVAEDCVFENTDDAANIPLYVHNNQHFDRPCTMHLKRCRITGGNGDVGIIQFHSLGSGNKDHFILENCVLDQGKINLIDGGWSNDDLDDPDHQEIQLTMSDVLPRAIDNSTLTKTCLRFKSKSTGPGSAFVFDQTSTAFNSIAGNSGDLSLYENNHFEIVQFGYPRKPGGVGVSGYATSCLDIYELAAVKFRRSLGKRLGDCSSVNKILTMTIDGTTYSVVFNKNYNGTAETVASNYTNAQILAEIVAVVGSVCDVSLYAYGCDYYPGFKGNAAVINSDTTGILAGMGLVFTGANRARLALNSDNKIDAIAIDDIPPGKRGRAITGGELFTQFTGQRFSIKEVSTATRAFGTMLGISASSPGLFDAAASPKLLNVTRTDVAKMMAR